MTSISSTDATDTNPAPLPVDADLLCGHCHQNLRGVASDRCPECGHRFDRAHILQSVIPWEQRKQIGRFKAYWRTVRFITFREPIAMEGAEVTLPSALIFRNVTLFLLCLVTVILIHLWRVYQPHDSARLRKLLIGQPMAFSRLPEFYSNPCFFVTSVIACCLVLIAATGVSGWFFHQRRTTQSHQRTAFALHCYSIGPLAWIPLLASLAVLFFAVEVHSDHTPFIFYPAAGAFGTLCVLCALCPIVYWLSILRLLYKVTRSRMRIFVTAVTLPILWLALVYAIPTGLQFAVNYLVFFYVSIRH